MHREIPTLEYFAACLQAEGTPYGTPYSSVGGFSNLQTPPHSLTGYSPLTHFHGSFGSSHLGTPARSGHSGSLQVRLLRLTCPALIQPMQFQLELCRLCIHCNTCCM